MHLSNMPKKYKRVKNYKNNIQKKHASEEKNDTKPASDEEQLLLQ